MNLKRTPEKELAFLTVLADTGNVGKAATAIGCGRTTVYAWREEDPVFSAKWDRALKISILGMEDEARRRAVEGVEEPVFDKDGKVSGVKTKYSDTLLIFLMKAHDPKYRENQRVELSGPEGGPIEMSQTQRAAKLAGLVERIKARVQRQPADDGTDLV